MMALIGLETMDIIKLNGSNDCDETANIVVNGSSGDNIHTNNNSGGDTIIITSNSSNNNNDDSFLSNSSNSNHDHTDHDNDVLQQRVLDLEKKIIDQADEIVCLRSTLADVLRRVTQLEGRASVITSNYVPNNNNNATKASHISPLRINSNSSMYSTNIRSPYNVRGDVNYNNNINNNSMVISNNNNVSNMNGNGNGIVNNAHRRLNNYPSNNSLQSEGGHSSNSASPVPSPSPSHHKSISFNRTITPTASPRHTPTPNRSHSASTSNLMSMRKWSASQEFRGNNLDIANNTKEATFNQDEGMVRIFLRGRPLVMHIPTELLQSYTLNKVNSPPTQRLKLEWVYGYRGRDCRHNLFLLPTGEIVYFIAAVVVLYNVEDQIQRHYLGHSDDIKCLTIHPNKLLIATGQVASHDRRDRRPHVRIWDSVSLNTLHIIGQNGDFERGISCLAFSKLDGGSLICIVDESNEHSISLWEWQRGDKGHKVTETKTSCDPVLAAEFHPMEKYTLVTIGKGHIHFWDIEGGTLAKKLGTFEKQEKPKYMLCMAFTDVGDLLTGDSNGNIMVWQKSTNRTIRTIHNAHDGGVFTICAMKDGTIVTGGGKDKRIVEWDCNLNRTGREAKLPEQFGGIRTLTTGKGSMLIVGTTKNCILQGTLTLNFSLVAQGHTEELWALAIHPTQNQFITAGYDRSIHLWDTMSHSVVWSKDIGESAQAATFSPDGNVLIITAPTGRWIVIDATTKQLISMHSDGNEQIDCIKFSPDGRFIALGSRDNHIYIYQVSDEFRKYNRIGRCSGHSSFITNIDWSCDGTYIQTNSGDYEHLFWNATICRQLNNMSIARDLKWHTHNSVLGFSVFGIWPENADGSDINSCDRSHSYKLLATGDDFGRVNLYNYPACQPRCLYHSYNGHSSHVTSVRFLPDDSRLISLGGKDCSIMQWSIN